MRHTLQAARAEIARIAEGAEGAGGADPRLDSRAVLSGQRLTVVYHAGCADGTAGAWAIYAALPPVVQGRLAALGGVFQDGRGPPAEAGKQRAAGAVFVGHSHGSPPPDEALVAGRDVVYVDIAPKAPELERLRRQAATLTVLDHHRSEADTLRAEARRAAGAGACPYALHYDEARSGAQLGWDWAHPGAARPPFVDYVADRDLWRHALPDSRAVNKALYVEGFLQGFAPLTALDAHAGGAIAPVLVARGAAYLLYEEAQVGRLVARARPVEVAVRLPGEARDRVYSALAVNTSVLASEVGEGIMRRAAPHVHFAVAWSYDHERNEIWASVRTTRPDVDLSALVPHIVGAEQAGGHARAAGFTVAGADVTRVLRPPP